MALEIVFARQADTDLFEILDFIAAENEAAPHAVAARIDHAIVLLSEHPLMGPMAPSTGQTGMRKISVPPYVIYYFVSSSAVRIARVLHSARDMDEKLFITGMP
jgi:toxin ParE1/3/4